MNRLRRKTLALFAPLCVAFLLCYMLPFGQMLIYSVTRAGFGSRFVGLRYYREALNNPYFLLALKNSALFTVLSVSALVFTALVLACLLQAAGRRLSFARGILLLPILMPSAAIAQIWKLLKAPELLSVYSLYLWRNAGVLALVLLAGLYTIPGELYEAAACDGAGFFRRLLRITLPLLSPVLMFAAVFGLVQCFSLYREMYLLFGDYPADDVYMIQHYIHNKFLKLDYAELSSGSMLYLLLAAALLVLILLIGQIGKERKR